MLDGGKSVTDVTRYLHTNAPGFERIDPKTVKNFVTPTVKRKPGRPTSDEFDRAILSHIMYLTLQKDGEARVIANVVYTYDIIIKGIKLAAKEDRFIDDPYAQKRLKTATTGDMHCKLA